QVYGVVNNAATVQEVADSLPLLKMTSALNGKYIILGGEYPPVEKKTPIPTSPCFSLSRKFSASAWMNFWGTMKQKQKRILISCWRNTFVCG
ncbi:MAG: hypothetical protein IIW82_04820, partial [Clostridia bacterium]|nr:hypothetical protein [Clostridia bacterium]